MEFCHSENHFLNSESYSENTPELSQSSENDSESVFPEIGVVTRLPSNSPDHLQSETRIGGGSVTYRTIEGELAPKVVLGKLGLLTGFSVESLQKGSANFHPPSYFRRFEPPYPGLQHRAPKPGSPKLLRRLLQKLLGKLGCWGGVLGELLRRLPETRHSSRQSPAAVPEHSPRALPPAPRVSPAASAAVSTAVLGGPGLGPCGWSGELQLKIRKNREGWNCHSQKTPRMEGGDKVRAVSTQGSRQVCLSWCPKSQNL